MYESVSLPFPQLFGTIQIASVDDPNNREINDYNNFSNFFRAFLVMIRYTYQLSHCLSCITLHSHHFLFLSLSPPPLPPSLPPSPLSLRVTTGENSPDVMLGCLEGQPCQLSDANDCGDDVAYVFFLVYYILTTILVGDSANNIVINDGGPFVALICCIALYRY